METGLYPHHILVISSFICHFSSFHPNSRYGALPRQCQAKKLSGHGALQADGAREWWRSQEWEEVLVFPARWGSLDFNEGATPSLTPSLLLPRSLCEPRTRSSQHPRQLGTDPNPFAMPDRMPERMSDGMSEYIIHIWYIYMMYNSIYIVIYIYIWCITIYIYNYMYIYNYIYITIYITIYI